MSISTKSQGKAFNSLLNFTYEVCDEVLEWANDNKMTDFEFGLIIEEMKERMKRGLENEIKESRQKLDD